MKLVRNPPPSPPPPEREGGFGGPLTWQEYAASLALMLAIGAVLSGLGLALDTASGDDHTQAHTPDVQAAIQQAIERKRFEAAAQALCGPHAAWAELPDGAVQCRTKHGKPTITVQVSP